MSETSHDDGFREIHLSGKQLVFLFMAITVVLVVTFLSGVLVGRGVRSERIAASQADTLTETPATPERSASLTPLTEADPRTAVPPPTPAEDEADAKIARAESEEPPVAAPRTPPGDSIAADTAKPATPAPDKPAPSSKAGSASKTAPASTPEKPAPQPAAGASNPPSEIAAPGSGYAVQVAAVNVRGEADAIVKRLVDNGYNAYVEIPKGSASMFRVRVGTFKTRREAQTVADKLKKEEKFNPWVTR